MTGMTLDGSLQHKAMPRPKFSICSLLASTVWEQKTSEGCIVTARSISFAPPSKVSRSNFEKTSSDDPLRLERLKRQVDDLRVRERRKSSP
jgi:hypothetical protein